MDSKTIKIYFNLFLIAQVFAIFLIAILTYSEPEKPTPITEFIPADHCKILKLFIAPINLIGIVFAASAVIPLLIVYYPLRWLCAYLMIESSVAQPMLFGGVILLEILIEVSLGMFIWKVYLLKKDERKPENVNKANLNLQQIVILDHTSGLPSYVEATT